MARNVELDDCRVVASHLDPENKEGDEEKAERQYREEQRIDDWVEDNLTPEEFMRPLRALIGEDSFLFLLFLEAYDDFDHAAFEQTAGTLARALKRQIRKTA